MCPAYGSSKHLRVISGPFRPEVLAIALNHLKTVKSPGLNYIFPLFILHAGSALKSWLCDVFTSFPPTHYSQDLEKSINSWYPKLWKPLWDAKNYRLISLFYDYFKILERLVHTRVEPIIDPLLSQEQAGFRHGSSTVDQITILMQDIEDIFSAKRTGAMLVDLTAAYETVWHRGLTCKLLRLLPGSYTVRMNMELVDNRSFTFATGDSKGCRLRRLKNGVPQGSVLARLLFNIYISDLANTDSRKFSYADDLAVMHADGDRQAMEGVLSKDLATIGKYLQSWKLKLSTTKNGLGSLPSQQQGS